MIDELKPCPFCGSMDIMRQSIGATMQHPAQRWMHCEQCGAYGPWVDANENPAKQWNVRPGETELSEYADKLAQGLPDGMLPADVENIRIANAKFAQQVHELTAELERLRKVEEYAAAMEAVNDTNRTFAQDIKDMRRAQRHAYSVNMGVEWWGENGEHYEMALSNLLDRLTR